MKNLKWLLICVCLVSCSQGEKKSDEKAKPIAVTVIDVKKGQLIESFKVLGEIEAKDSVPIFSKVQGKLINYTVKKGDTIRKGQAVAHLDRDEIGFKYETAAVLSTIDGTVGDVPKARGEETRPGEVLALIINLNEVKAVMHVSEKRFGEVALGQRASVFVDAYPGRRFEGIISEISPIIEKSTRTFPVEINIANEEKLLLPGMFVKAEILINETGDALLLPEEAVISSQFGLYVYKMEEGKAVKQSVTIGERRPGEVQILSGVKAGDQVVLTGHQKIDDGREIVAIEN